MGFWQGRQGAEFICFSILHLKVLDLPGSSRTAISIFKKQVDSTPEIQVITDTGYGLFTT